MGGAGGGGRGEERALRERLDDAAFAGLDFPEAMCVCEREREREGKYFSGKHKIVAIKNFDFVLLFLIWSGKLGPIF